MLDIQTIRNNPEKVRAALREPGRIQAGAIDAVLRQDSLRRELLTKLQKAQAAAKNASKAIGVLMQTGKQDEAKAAIARNAQLKQEAQALGAQVRDAEAKLEKLLLDIPNIPHESVPSGRSANENVVLGVEGTPATFDFAPLPHWKLAAKHGIIDFERGAKVTGAGFPFYLGKGARLQRGLINFFLDLATTRGGYTEVQAPLFVNEASARGTGQLPDKEGQMYAIGLDGFYAVPTAEVPLTNFYRNDIIPEEALPIKICGYTPCWRREAGSYGQNVRGLNRLHQFDKVELVQIVTPERSYDALEDLLADAERAVRMLGLPYRRLLMCAGDMGFNQAKQYDLEVWSAGQGRYLEVSSISNFTSYQATRMQLRYRPATGGKPRHVHTLNGSALALPRIVATLLENNQRADGSIVIPECLVPYTGFDCIG